MTLAIEIVDAGLLVRSAPPLTTDLPSSPGYALVGKDGLRTGAAALAAARLQPKQIDNQFWGDLSTQLVAGPRGDLSAADLAHGHLAAVWEQVVEAAPGGDLEVLLVLPGSYGDAQLGLVLGIARACGMPVAGMVDAAVAAAAGAPGAPPIALGCRHLLHLDIMLHCTVVTDLVRDGDLTRRGVEVNPRLGLVSLYDQWARRIARAFVHATRFDPLHGAATEQELYDRLPTFLQQLAGRDVATLRIEAGGSTHAVEVSKSDLASAVDADLQAIVHLVGSQMHAGEPTAVLLSHRAAALPGLRQRLTEIGDAVIVDLPEGAAAAAALEHVGHIRSPGEALPFVTQLPTAGAADASPPVVGMAPTPAAAVPASAIAPATAAASGGVLPPTHILHEGRAHPLTAQAFVVGTAIPAGHSGIELRGQTDGISRSHCTIRLEGDRVVVVDHSTYGSFLNGQRIDAPQALALGDRLRLGSPGLELVLIRVEDS